MYSIDAHLLTYHLCKYNRNGIQQRKNSWQDGVSGTNCPIPPGQNYTYRMQAKDQIGSFFYYPSLAFHKAAGGFGAIRINSRPRVPVPFPPPADEYTVLIGDWYNTTHKVLRPLHLNIWLRLLVRNARIS
jgi:FtsP/CotA-like multicopper oxidase with cupredoxin domain